MKLLLTSAGFENSKIGKEFLKLVDKAPQDIKVLFIPTASRTKEELFYVEKSKKELEKLKISRDNIITYNLDYDMPDEKLKEFDVIYVCGGNTFYLLHRVRESGFGETIKSFVEEGKLYVGVSAGSILAGPNIDIAAPSDENDIKIKDTTGLELTNIIVSPHYTDKEKHIVDEFKKVSKFQVIPLTDRQALLITDKKHRILE